MSAIILNFRFPKETTKPAATKALEAFEKKSGLSLGDAAIGRAKNVKHVAVQLSASASEDLIKAGISAFAKKLTDAQRAEFFVDVDFDQTGETCCYAMIGDEAQRFESVADARELKDSIKAAPIHDGDLSEPYAIVRFGGPWPGVVKRFVPVFQRMLEGACGSDGIELLIEEGNAHGQKEGFSYDMREFVDDAGWDGVHLGPFNVDKDLLKIVKEKNAVLSVWRISPERWSVRRMEAFMEIFHCALFTRSIAKVRNLSPEMPEAVTFNIEDCYYTLILGERSADRLWSLDALDKLKNRKLTDRMAG